MSEDIRSMSAFAVYKQRKQKRKNLVWPATHKMKKKRSLLESVMPNQDSEVEKVKEIINKEVKSKRTLNVATKTGATVNAKEGSLESDLKNSKKQGKKKNLDGKKISINRKGKPKSIKCIKPKSRQLGHRILNCENNVKNVGFTNPIESSIRVFEWLIYPMKANDFLTQHWEKRSVHIKREKSSYYSHLVSTPSLDKILKENNVLFTKNIDITSYSNGTRETHNPPGRAVPGVVWDYYLNDCSVRMLNPQTFIRDLHELNATLQEFFGCFVGSNLYLTPPNSQGFAPHYDDIEAFILQIEGKKRWRLYKPPNEKGYLARYSSKNFDQSELGKPILDTIVMAGDLLYFPRGTVHQAETIDDTHSLHITLSVYQKNSWCDLLEKLLPQALRRLTETDSRFRSGLPLGCFRQFGAAYITRNDCARTLLKTEIKTLLTELIDHIDVDDAVDSMAKSHIHDFLPPFLTANERKCSVMENGKTMISNGVVINRVEIESDTKIRLLRLHCIRLIKDENIYRIYFSTENSKEFHEYDLQFLEVEEEFVPAIRKIITCYPEFVRVGDLPIDDDDAKVQVVTDLWEKGLIITHIPLSIAQEKQERS